MPGSRKVRVYQDLKKSPSWYIEWRDSDGRRHTESCGLDRADADDRAKQILQQLRVARSASGKAIPGESQHPSTKTTLSVATNLLRLRAKIECGESEVPVEINVELTPVFLEALRELIRPISGR